MLSILDGVQSICYLCILLQYGDEVDVRQFYERKARGVPQKLPQYKLYYETVAWKMAQGMCRGLTFKQVADEILAMLWQETMAKVIQEQPDRAPKKRAWEPIKSGKGKSPKGAGRGQQHWKIYGKRNQ